MGSAPRRIEELSSDAALGLLGSVSHGRVIFTEGGLPAVLPVPHIVADGEVVIGAEFGSAGMWSAGLVVVVYEAGGVDRADRTGWTAVVTGRARLIDRPDQVRRFKQLLQPWVSDDLTRVVGVDPEYITAYELAAPIRSGSGSGDMRNLGGI
jgi:Pyridoxamine 5'-phosphate oxidase